MVLVLVTILVAIAIGYVRRGRLSNLGRLTLRGSWLLAVAVAAQAILAAVSAAGASTAVAGPVLLLGSHAALLGFMWLNRMLPGMLLIFLGIAMNIAVIAANGAMPVSGEAIAAISPGAEFDPGKHRLLTDGDRLTFLADIFPLPLLRSVVSVGDIVLSAGAGILVVTLMRPDLSRHGRHSRLAAALRPAAEDSDAEADATS